MKDSFAGKGVCGVTGNCEAGVIWKLENSGE